MYRGSAYILLGRRIDANDHMHIENFAVDEKQRPPFCQNVLGVYPFFGIRPKSNVDIRTGTHNIYEGGAFDPSCGSARLKSVLGT